MTQLARTEFVRFYSLMGTRAFMSDVDRRRRAFAAVCHVLLRAGETTLLRTIASEYTQRCAYLRGRSA